MPRAANTPAQGPAHPEPGAGARPKIADFDFSRSPFVVIWETTRACDLACKHCRAEAVPFRNPNELTTAEAKAMLERVREFGKVVFVLSGGDLLKRPDVFELIEYGFNLGLRMAVTPATTPLATPETIRRLKDAGISRLAVSIDGSAPAIHDEFRRVQGSFDWGMRILETCREIGLSTQVNTVFAKHNIDDFDNLAALMERMGIVFWEVFFLVPTGRAKPDDVASAEAFEMLFNKMYDLSKTAPFDIKATAAPQYSRVILQRQVAERREGSREESPDVLTGGVMFSLSDGIGRARSVNDGDGFMFVSHTGDIMPSGFLPIKAGNVRTDDIVDVYRNSPLFAELRDRTRLKGKCGVCEFQKVCGGSRARAYGMTGDYLEAEPFCAYVPPRWARMVERGEAEPVEEYFARRVRGARPLPLASDAALEGAGV
ncbi:MAG TPA: TIGR04053 family radical SAM/SPASM domain-containing protein [Gemmatimonadaceae bacterium]|nr:TIGR04053 family radical SAM/SPASM domain-containing protein [Gemmatimonadaceae bacterium]